MKNRQQEARVGSPAPDFMLRDGNDELWSLSGHRGKVIVLFFYPGDETPVCTPKCVRYEIDGEIIAPPERKLLASQPTRSNRTAASPNITICRCDCCLMWIVR